MRTTHFQCLPLKTLLLCILSFLVPARPHVITDFFGWEGISIYVLYCRGQKSAWSRSGSVQEEGVLPEPLQPEPPHHITVTQSLQKQTWKELSCKFRWLKRKKKGHWELICPCSHMQPKKHQCTVRLRNRKEKKITTPFSLHINQRTTWFFLYQVSQKRLLLARHSRSSSTAFPTSPPAQGAL